MHTDLSHWQSIPQFTNQLRHSLLIPTTSLTATVVATLQRWPPTMHPIVHTLCGSLPEGHDSELILCLAFDYKHIAIVMLHCFWGWFIKRPTESTWAYWNWLMGEDSLMCSPLTLRPACVRKATWRERKPAQPPVVPVTPARMTEVFSWSNPCHHQTRVPTWEVPSWAQSAQSHKRQW